MSYSFTEKVIEIVKNIPKGETLSYKEVAKKAGNEKAARAVGMIMSKNYNSEIPCHRVIGSNGKAKGYNRGTEKKIQILKEEGINLHSL